MKFSSKHFRLVQVLFNTFFFFFWGGGSFLCFSSAVDWSKYKCWYLVFIDCLGLVLFAVRCNFKQDRVVSLELSVRLVVSQRLV